MAQQVEPKRPHLPELTLKLAEAIRTSPYFVDHSGDGTCVEKQSLFLVVCGAKPVGSASSGHWEAMSDGRRTVADDPDEVAAFLTGLGLSYQLTSPDGHATDAVFSLDPELLVQYAAVPSTGDDRLTGRLYGYPDTAVEAFAEGRDALLPPEEEEEQRIADAGIDPNLVTFYLSRAHWRNELEVVRRWMQLCELAGLITESPTAGVARNAA
jgi:hypothetical protein